jgi:hypothetical protein
MGGNGLALLLMDYGHKVTYRCGSGKTEKANQVGNSLGVHCPKVKKMMMSVCRSEACVKGEKVNAL